MDEGERTMTHIKGLFKQATVKGGLARLQFDIETDTDGAFELIRQAGRDGILSFDCEQQSIDLHADPETGEIYYMPQASGR
jgi:hypothetical protein